MTPDDSVPLREHFDRRVTEMDLRYQQRFEAQSEALAAAFAVAEKAVQAALHAADRAVSKAEAATERRFEGVNEFRSTLSDQQRTFIPRIEADAKIERWAEKCVGIEKRLDAIAAERSGSKLGWAAAVALVMFVIAVVALISKFRP